MRFLKIKKVTLKNVSKPGLSDLYKPKAPMIDPDADADEVADATPVQDIVMQEAQNILIDYAALLKGQPVVSQR